MERDYNLILPWINIRATFSQEKILVSAEKFDKYKNEINVVR